MKIRVLALVFSILMLMLSVGCSVDDSRVPSDITSSVPSVDGNTTSSENVSSDTASSQIKLPTDMTPGFKLQEGWLFYVTENKQLLKDGKVGDLYFDADGRYTSGNAELDKLVADTLTKLVNENPDKKGEDLLRVIHVYCRDNFKYLRRKDGDLDYGATGWAANKAYEMMSTGRGNCYNFAAAFWALSRGIGYETYAISGTCTKTNQPHGWCLINIDGKDYFFDCEWEYAYYYDRVQHPEPRYEMDMFKIPMSKISYWKYKWDKY